MEGIWYAHFTSGPAHGDGLAVLRNGIIQGGDPEHTYEGFYSGMVWTSTRMCGWLPVRRGAIFPISTIRFRFS